MVMQGSRAYPICVLSVVVRQGVIKSLRNGCGKIATLSGSTLSTLLRHLLLALSGGMKKWDKRGKGRVNQR
jgi:hypothetical protein